MNESISQAVRELQAAKAEEAVRATASQESETKAKEAFDALLVAQGGTSAARKRLLQIAEGV